MTIPKQTRLRRILADLHKLESAAAFNAAVAVERYLSSALAAFRRGDDPLAGLSDLRARLRTESQIVAATAHITGRVLSYENIGRKELRRTTPRSALDFIKRKARLDEIEIEWIKSIYAERSARLSGTIGNLLEEGVSSAMVDIQTTGMLRRQGAELLVERIGVAKALAETQYRTQTQLAYSAGRLEANKDPAIDIDIWGYEYNAVNDDRVRPTHLALDGVKLPKDHPRWQEIMPPNGWNCRCSVIEVFTDERPRMHNPISKKVDGVKVMGVADEGWEFNPAELFAAVSR